MRVSKWGGSLAIRLPVAVLEALDLREGDNVEVYAMGKHVFEIYRKSETQQSPQRLRKFRSCLSCDFKIVRVDAHERLLHSATPMCVCPCGRAGSVGRFRNGRSPRKRRG
jgi:antitoxin MazE